jgi:hypothetical protein
MKKLKLLLLPLLLVLMACKPTSSKELQRYKTKIVEIVSDYDYIVEKYNYVVGGIFYLTTEQKLELELDEIVYVIVMPDNYHCRLFSEYVEIEE